jgi:hypothetical protein
MFAYIFEYGDFAMSRFFRPGRMLAVLGLALGLATISAPSAKAEPGTIAALAVAKVIGAAHLEHKRNIRQTGRKCTCPETCGYQSAGVIQTTRAPFHIYHEPYPVRPAACRVAGNAFDVGCLRQHN